MYLCCYSSDLRENTKNPSLEAAAAAERERGGERRGVGKRDGIWFGDLRPARGGGCASPHAGASGIDLGEGAAERAESGGGPLRGDLPVRRPRPPEDEVSPISQEAHEHQTLPRPHPLPCSS